VLLVRGASSAGLIGRVAEGGELFLPRDLATGARDPTPLPGRGYFFLRLSSRVVEPRVIATSTHTPTPRNTSSPLSNVVITNPLFSYCR
jgi:hypothetical protein